MANSYNTNPIVINTVMANTAVSSISIANGVATALTGTTPAVGAYVSLNGFANTAYNNTWLVTAAVTNTSFSFIPYLSGIGTGSTGNWCIGWRGAQTLNVGYIPSNAQQVSGPVPRQTGLFVEGVLWTGATATGHTFSIVDPTSGTVLLAGVAGTTLIDVQYIFDNAINWRDFAITQLSSGSVYVWYR